MTPFWAISFHSNSNNPRAKKWYRVARFIKADGMLFELYWHSDVNLRSDNLANLRKLAREHGIDLAPGTYRDAPSPRQGNTMERTS